MNRAQSLARPATAFGIALVAAAAIMASGVLGGTPAPSPSDPPASPVPSSPPVVTPSPAPSEAPAGGPIKVDLDNATDHDVSVLIDDQTGRLSGAVSGQPGDGMTVRWHDYELKNLDGSTLSLVWVGLPQDEAVAMSISKVDGKYRIRIVQAGPLPNTDALGADRILTLSFDGPISADDVKVTIKNA